MTEVLVILFWICWLNNVLLLDFRDDISDGLYEEFCEASSWEVYPDTVPFLEEAVQSGHKLSVRLGEHVLTCTRTHTRTHIQRTCEKLLCGFLHSHFLFHVKYVLLEPLKLYPIT